MGALEQYLAQGERNYSVYQNMAIIAIRTGRTDEAIRLLHQALDRASKREERAQIHGQLFELKRAGKAAPKEVMRQAVEYGKNMGSEPEHIARYLMMFMLCPAVPEDGDVKRWIAEYRERAEKFFRENPDFPALRRFVLPKGMSPQDQVERMLAQLASVTLEHRLRAAGFEIGARSTPWPFVFRREVLLPSGSVFDFWKYCTGSKERGYEIWIWTSANLLNEENQVAQRASSVCVDISALLSLTDLGLLDALRRAFTTIVIPHEIDNLLLQQRHGIDAPHPLATALSNWIQQNRGLVRLRTRMGGEEEEAPVVGPFLIGDAGIYVPHRPPMSDVLRGGTGDAMLLAKELQIPLYSDDTAVRQMARTECGVQGFSTISLVARLQAEGKLSVEQEAEILARMLSKHFRAVPIAPEHLTARLRVLYDAARANGRALRIDDMRRDNVLGTLLPELWDTVLTLQARAMLTTGWWLDVARDDSFPQDVLDETIPVPSFAIAQEAKGGVILGISEKGPEKVAALLWTAFLWRAWRSEEALLGRAWSAVKTAARRRSRGQHDYERYIWDWVPKMLTRIIEQCQDLTDLQKASNWVKLDMALPAEDRTHFERVHATQQPSFKR